MIYLSSFFKNSFLSHFDDPKLYPVHLKPTIRDDKVKDADMVMCLGRLENLRDDLIINM